MKQNVNYSFWRAAIGVALISMFVLYAVKPGIAEAFILRNQEEARALLPIAGERVSKRVMRVVATAYTSTPDQTDDTPFITANGTMVQPGIIAANFLAMGTVVRLPELFGSQLFVVADRMNPRYGRGRIDIWLDAERAIALEFGVKRTKMEIF